MNLLLLSKYRSELMGIAMLMVVFHHLAIPVHNETFEFFHMHGGFGVDIFLLLSGLGIAFSIRKGLDLRTYYIKRFVRIFPVYAFVILVVTVVRGDFNVIDYFLKVTTIGWWTNGVNFDWFIPNIVLLYLVYPLFHVITSSKKYGYLIGIAIIVLMCVYPILFHCNYQQCCRWPVFFLGVLVGRMIIDKDNMSVNVERHVLSLSSIEFIIGCALTIWAWLNVSHKSESPYLMPEIKTSGWLFFPYIYIVIGFCLILTRIFAFDTIINIFLRVVGSMSIEIYLLHGQFIMLSKYLCENYGLQKQIIGGVMVISSFVFAYLLHKGNMFISERIKYKMLIITTI